MKPTEIEVGKTYTDGKTERTVNYRNENYVWWFYRYHAKGTLCKMSTFVRWAKSEVKHE